MKIPGAPSSDHLYAEIYVNKSFENKELNLLAAGRHVIVPPLVSHHQNCHSYHLHYILKGEGTLRYCGNAVKLKKNDMFLLYPGYEYYYATDNENPWEYIWVEFLGHSADNIIKQTEFTEAYPYCHVEKDLSCYLKNMLKHKGPLEADRYSMLGYLYLFLSKLMVSPANKDEEMLEKILDYIKNHYSESITLDKLSRALKMSRDTLHRIFKNRMNTTLSSYMVRYRVHESLYLLSNTNFTISKISNMVGFYDQFHYSNAFKKLMNMTPSQYRKNINNVRVVENKNSAHDK